MRNTRLVALLLCAAAVGSPARAAQYEASSTTQFLWYPDFLSGTASGTDRDQRDVAQYLRLDGAFGEKDAIRVHAYGRVVGQFMSSVESRPELLDNVIGRLYYLNVDWRDALPGHLDLRAGRTSINMSATAAIVDGADLRFRNLGLEGLGVALAGGRRVWLDNRSEVGAAKASVWGASLFYDTFWRTHAEVGYAREYGADALAREILAADLSTAPHQMVGLYGRVKYDMVSSRYAEALAGLTLSPVQALTLRAEYFESAPSFDKESFYRYFSVTRYGQASLAAEWQVLTMLRLDGRYAREAFGGGETANLWGAGAALRPSDTWYLKASYEHRDGYAGRLGGLRFDGGYRLGPAMVMAGADYDDFRRDGARDGTAKRYWGSLSWDFNRNLGVLGRAELDQNFQFDKSYQGYLALVAHL